MDPWHTEIKNVTMRIWDVMRWRCNVGTWKVDHRMNKDGGGVYIHCFPGGVCWGASKTWFCLLNSIHMQSCEKIRYMWRAKGRCFPWRSGRDWSCWQVGECASITQQLWAVLVQALGLKRTVASSRLLFPAPSDPLKNVPPQQVHQWIHPAQSC